MLGSELCAQSSYVNIDGTNATMALIAPHLTHEPSPGERPTGMLHKEIHEFEFGERQPQVPVAQRRGLAGWVKDEVPELQCAR